MKKILFVANHEEALAFIDSIRAILESDDNIEICTLDPKAYAYLHKMFSEKTIIMVKPEGKKKEGKSPAKGSDFLPVFNGCDLVFDKDKYVELIVIGEAPNSFSAALAAFNKPIKVVHFLESPSQLFSDAENNYGKMISLLAQETLYIDPTSKEPIRTPNELSSITKAKPRKYDAKESPLMVAGKKITVLFVFGTRPEAIKMQSLIKEFSKAENIRVRVCITGQHEEMVRDILKFFNIQPDYKLKIMKPGQTINYIVQSVYDGVSDILQHDDVDYVFVQGDTSSGLSAALAAHEYGVSVAHVEAGLRTYDRSAPWPEEINRIIIGQIATLHFAPTKGAYDNLILEGIPAKSVFITGNTGIDSLHYTLGFLKDSKQAQAYKNKFLFLDPKKKTILVTAHRRENHGQGLLEICGALKTLSQRADVQIVFPVHMSPSVKHVVHKQLGELHNIYLIQPQDYIDISYLMSRCYLVMTDSGGIQEEAPGISPILVLRESTERPEALECGAAQLVGASQARICAAASQILEQPEYRDRMITVENPYGDGRAAEKILEHFLVKVATKRASGEIEVKAVAGQAAQEKPDLKYKSKEGSEKILSLLFEPKKSITPVAASPVMSEEQIAKQGLREFQKAIGISVTKPG